MAVQSIAKSAKARLTLNRGMDPVTGKDVIRYVTLSGLAPEPDGEKVMNVVEAAAPCLSGIIGAVETTEVKTLERV